jgi:mannose-6-phosphate isomerase-like protein (cupin superfamily)
MKNDTIHLVKENEIETQDLPGRKLRWLFSPEGHVAKHCSMNVVEIGPYETVRPAHAHPGAEEIIYVLSGSGKVWVDEKIRDIEINSAVLFPAGSVHMVRNDNSQPLRLACFFAPPIDSKGYEFYEEAGFSK